MYKLKCSDENFLYEIVEHLENGENLERALFYSLSVPSSIKFALQIGQSFERAISMLKFNYTITYNLLVSLLFNTNKEAITRIKITADIISKQHETLREKDSIIKYGP